MNYIEYLNNSGEKCRNAISHCSHLLSHSNKGGPNEREHTACCTKKCEGDNNDCFNGCHGNLGGGCPGEHIPEGPGGPDNPGRRTNNCNNFPGCGQGGGNITLDGGECVCGTGGTSFKTLKKCCYKSSRAAGLCHQFNCGVGGGGGGPPGGGGGGPPGGGGGGPPGGGGGGPPG